jgi:predicted O-linked N-acetylglucosamine transferase (SPINDLY family)
MFAIAELLAQAKEHQTAGRLQASLEALGAILRVDANHAEAHYLTGVALVGLGRSDEAIDSLRTSLRVNPADVAVWQYLGSVLSQRNRLDEAAVCLQRAVELAPNQERLHNFLGTLFEGQRRAAEAEACFRRALALNPNYAISHSNLGNVLLHQGRSEEALASYRRAVELNPNLAAAHYNLAHAWQTVGNLGEAVSGYQRALAIQPDFVEARYNLGNALRDLGDRQRAIEQFRRVVELQPGHIGALLHLGNIFREQGPLEEAISCYRKILAVDPRCAEAHGNLGVAFNEQGSRDEAIESIRRAIELAPRATFDHSNLGLALQSVGRLDEALVEYRQAVALAPDNSGLHSNLLYALHYHPLGTAESLFREHLDWAERHANPLTTRALPHALDRSPGPRLRVGYVSPYFRAHAINFFFEPILAAHDREQFEIICYSDSAVEDETTQRLRSHASLWRSSLALSNEQFSAQIRQDKIDILVDLTGHIAGGLRLLAFARKSAPVQVTYLGYQNTTGMQAMDYRLTDEWSDPPGTTEHLHSEKLVRLPNAFYCYLPSPDAPPITRPPAEAAGLVTFGSFNYFAKVTPEVLATWAKILARVPRSRLVILADMAQSLRARLVEYFATHGIAAERLELVHRLPRARYLELINNVDIALDPFPFNGHTTTCDCLWQGVPVVTLSGQTYVSRFGSSAHRVLDLTSLVAQQPQQYVEIAASLAADLTALAALRANLRERMAASALLDSRTFTSNLEAEYRRMWNDWLGRRTTVG